MVYLKSAIHIDYETGMVLQSYAFGAASRPSRTQVVNPRNPRDRDGQLVLEQR
jgi:hypothetical protein